MFPVPLKKDWSVAELWGQVWWGGPGDTRACDVFLTIRCLSRVSSPWQTFPLLTNCHPVTQSLLMSPFIMIPGHQSAEEPSDRLMSPLVAAIQWSPVSRLLGLISADNQMSWSVIIMPGQLPHHHYPVSEYQSITVSSVPDSLHLSTCQTIVSPYLSTLSAHFNSPSVSDWLK